MQAIPEMRANKIVPPTALFRKAPTKNPAKADITIIISDTTVLNLLVAFTTFYLASILPATSTSKGRSSRISFLTSTPSYT